MRALLLAGLAALVLAAAVDAAPVPAWYWGWAKWRLGHAPYVCQAGDRELRPAAPRRVPRWAWQRLRRHEPRPCPPATPPAPAPRPSPAPPASSPAPPAPPAPAPLELEPREAELRDAVNAERARRGLAALPVRRDLTAGARAHVDDLIAGGYFAHRWSDGRPFDVWVRDYTACPSVGEVLAWRSPAQTAAGAVAQWLDSPGHREALLAPSAWDAMGVELGAQHAAVLFGRCV